MQNPRSTSTLELVVNEQQLQNMSQIDLSQPNDNHGSTIHRPVSQPATDQQTDQSDTSLAFRNIRKWPARVRASLSAKFNEAKAKSENKTQLIFRLMEAFSGVIIWFLCFVSTILMPVLLLCIGLFNIDNCPILTNHHILSNDVKNTVASTVNIIFNCMVAFLYVLTAYMVFSVPFVDEPPQEQPEERELVNCNSLLYYFTFWFIVSTVSLILLLCLVASSLFLYNQYRLAIIRGSTPRSQDTTVNLSTQVPNTMGTNRV